MKKMYLAIASILISLAITSCYKSDLGANNTTTVENESNPKGGNITTTANPVIANMGYITIGRGSNARSYYSIAVMDANGTNQTHLYYSSGLGFNPAFRHLTWSPTAGNVCFIEADSKVKKLSVTLVNGVPTGSNVTDLATFTAFDSVFIRNIAWSPSSSTSEIAFTKTRYAPTDVSQRRSSIMAISPSGGTPTEIYYELGSIINSITWSPDGSKIALLSLCAYGSNTGVRTIKIINRSTGEVLNSYNMGTTDIRYLNWSRTGLNKLLFTTRSGTNTGNLYTFDLDEASPSPVQVTLSTGANPTHPDWTADNSKIIYIDNRSQPDNGCKTVTLSNGSIATINSTLPVAYPDWKR